MAAPSPPDSFDVLSNLPEVHPGTADLFPSLYNELRTVAHRLMSAERPGNTLQGTALLHEAYARLVSGGAAEQRWDSRGHFLTAVVTSMRRVLVDRARAKAATKRGGGRGRSALADDVRSLDGPAASRDGFGGGALDAAVSELATDDPDAFVVVMLRFGAGLTTEQTAEALGVTDRTVKRRWSSAKGALMRAVSAGE